jgi:hypothetical protein
MPSLWRSLFDIHATPQLFTSFGNERVQLVYRIGDAEAHGIFGVVRDRATAMEMDTSGDAIKQERCTIVISTDPGSPWGGVESPQLKATWEIIGEDGVSTMWGVDPYPGKGIESLSESLAVIHLVRMYGMAKSIPNYRVQ